MVRIAYKIISKTLIDYEIINIQFDKKKKKNYSWKWRYLSKFTRLQYINVGTASNYFHANKSNSNHNFIMMDGMNQYY